MKIFLLVPTLLFYAASLFAQDLIVTNNNDSINCKILGIEGNDMLYKEKTVEGMNMKSISLANLKFYSYKFYSNQKKNTAAPVTTIVDDDLIITNEKDSIRCKIMHIKGNDMFYQYNTPGGPAKTSISLADMTYYAYHFYTGKTAAVKHLMDMPVYPEHKGRISINIGYGNWYGSKIDLPSEYKYYENGLKSGITFAGDFSYYFTRSFGLGVKASLYKSGKEEAYHGQVSDKISIGYFGPELFLRGVNANHTDAMFLGLTAGCAGYKDEGYYTTTITIRAKAFAYGIDLGYEHFLAETVAIITQVSLLGGTINKFDARTYLQSAHFSDGNYEHLGRFDISVGVRFGL